MGRGKIGKNILTKGAVAVLPDKTIIETGKGFFEDVDELHIFATKAINKLELGTISEFLVEVLPDKTFCCSIKGIGKDAKELVELLQEMTGETPEPAMRGKTKKIKSLSELQDLETELK